MKESSLNKWIPYIGIAIMILVCYCFGSQKLFVKKGFPVIVVVFVIAIALSFFLGKSLSQSKSKADNEDEDEDD